MTGQVRLDSAGATAFVTLSHPGRLNAMSRAMWLGLREVFQRIQAASQWRCVVVQGEGGAFCAGGDISEYPAFRFDAAALRHFHEVEVWGALQAMLDCDVPLLARIDGACMGAGVEIASCCDLRIAGASARFGAPIARLGFPMAPRELALVARVAGEATAREMLLQAAALDAAEMKQRGFLHQVVADTHLAAETEKRCRAIESLAPQAARLNKQALRLIFESNRPFAPDQRAHLAMNTVAQSARTRAAADPYAYADSAEHREGIGAFLEKRRPDFQNP